MNMIKLDTAYFAAGCFWCVDALFQHLDGVIKVESGYAGGHSINPSYKDVCTGTKGHAEVCKITFNPMTISFETLLSIFWQTHDPTTLNRQGNDIGTQYRSAIFYSNDEQKRLAEKYKSELNTSGAFRSPIVTEISALINYYPAENYHQNYFNQNSEQSYCKFVIAPKVEKLKEVFKDKLKIKGQK
ncbi:MAG: peptide-methionine (S)-S-oxide reductase MsrA [Bacteroidetes bacterium]|nr:peptide-methionine (S)-S-oxide reductase MsrA [Bacteroidota bacterium]